MIPVEHKKYTLKYTLRNKGIDVWNELEPEFKDIYMLFTEWEVRTGKIFCRGLKNGPRPKAEGRF